MCRWDFWLIVRLFALIGENCFHPFGVLAYPASWVEAMCVYKQPGKNSAVWEGELHVCPDSITVCYISIIICGPSREATFY